MPHFEALGLHYQKMVVVLPKCDAIRVKKAFILGCLENTGVNFVRFFSVHCKRVKALRGRENLFSPSTINCFFKNTFEIFI